MTATLYRQGDLVLRRLGDAADTCEPREVTLAVGEYSGHSHVIRGTVARALAATVAVGLLDLASQAELRVAGMPWRHDPLILPPGRYEYWIERELSPEDEVRHVID